VSKLTSLKWSDISISADHISIKLNQSKTDPCSSKSKNLVTLVYVAIPADKRIYESEQKVSGLKNWSSTSYRAFVEQMNKWSLGHLAWYLVNSMGTLNNWTSIHNLNKYVLQNIAILGTATILRKVSSALKCWYSHSSWFEPELTQLFIIFHSVNVVFSCAFLT